MVDTWKNERVKIDGVTHHINEDLIAQVTEIPLEGIKFYRDKKMSANAVNEFVKDDTERNKLVKAETYYKMESIKKLWRYVLRVIIEYFTLDSRFDGIRTHHFVLLNHFRHRVKNFVPFYLFTSMSKGIEGFKRKPTANLALHEGLLLLVYEFLRTQTWGKSLGDPGCASVETVSSDSGDVQCVKSDDKENTTKVIPVARIPNRKSPRSLPPIPPKPEP